MTDPQLSEPYVFSTRTSPQTFRDGYCVHCGQPIRTGYYTCRWWHQDTGKPECDLPPIPLTAYPAGYDDEEF